MNETIEHCDWCKQDIRPGDGILTECGVWVHNVPIEDNAEHTCYDDHYHFCCICT